MKYKSALKIAMIAGFFRDLAVSRGGTGTKRSSISGKEAHRLKRARKQTKISRRANR